MSNNSGQKATVEGRNEQIFGAFTTGTNAGAIIALLGVGLMFGVTEAAEGVAIQTREEALRQKHLQAVRVSLAQEVKKQAAKEPTAVVCQWLCEISMPS